MSSNPNASIPLAYHITFGTYGTYGTRLHGDERGTVARGMNHFGDPIIGKDDDWERLERSLLRFDPVYLNDDHRARLERSFIPDVCSRGSWTLRSAAARLDHVHVLLSAQVADGKAIRKWLNRWLSEHLSEIDPLPTGARWWAKGGSVKYVWTTEYFDRVFNYVQEQRFLR